MADVNLKLSELGWDTEHIDFEHMICASLRITASVMYDYMTWQKFVFVLNHLGVYNIFYQRYFVSNYQMF